MINRRNCIKSLAGLFGAAAAVSAKRHRKPNKQTKKDEYDVVILGAGTGGLVTAIEAYDPGLKPIVLEKMDYAAGNFFVCLRRNCGMGYCTAESGRSRRIRTEFPRRHDEGL